VARIDLRREQLALRIGKEVYYTSADGLLMPAKKDQPPPDLRYSTGGR